MINRCTECGTEGTKENPVGMMEGVNDSYPMCFSCVTGFDSVAEYEAYVGVSECQKK